ncbi:hypothetical protein HBE96_08965 [Clostridium sp. P21]|uniref:Uncharacterized protein n=2 Tax=Clostridium muellerianum TaxID=2716538 RepID=A0A7Y0EG78_9CLOT|nr:hypothetical protein [Clostridium muellerianum]
MDFYLNENHLIVDKENIVENLKEIKQFYDLLKAKNYKLCIKDNLDLDYKNLNTNKSISILLAFLKYLNSIETYGVNTVESDKIDPFIDNYYFIELISLCHKYNNNVMLSSANENEIIHPEYKININEKEEIVKNILGKSKLEEYLIFNPAPKNIDEVFQKAESEFSHIKFTDKAYKTANSREDIYKQYGFTKLLNVFKILEQLIYPFLKGELQGFSEDSIEVEFKKQTNGVEFSHESDSTMNKYGKKREVTVKGRKLKMDYHIKLSDNRIYFIYDKKDDCIYIGHSGEHLQTAD